VRLTFGDLLMSVGAVAVLLLTLVAVDHRVREEISLRIGIGPASAEVKDRGEQLHDLGHILFVAARDQTIDHAPLTMFVVVGAGLVMLMLRT